MTPATPKFARLFWIGMIELAFRGLPAAQDLKKSNRWLWIGMRYSAYVIIVGWFLGSLGRH